MDTVNERFTAGGSGPEGQSDTVDESPSAPAPVEDAVEVPAHSASKADWVDFAVAQGAVRDEAESQTKQDLIDSYGG